MIRKIIHIDMDAFYASVEQRDFPQLRGKPVAVGGIGPRGVVAAASYEARKYGIHSAMATSRARILCPDLAIVKPRFDQYQLVSQQIRQIFAAHTQLIEPLALDEAYLDVTDSLQPPLTATSCAMTIKENIFSQTGLTASAGVSYNKFLAKIASDYRKPDGLFVIKPAQGADFVSRLAIEKFHGIGKVTAKKMHQLGIHDGASLRKLSEAELVLTFGKMGHFFYHIARGCDDRPVLAHRPRKSIGAERTFACDMLDFDFLLGEMAAITARACHGLKRKQLFAGSVAIKIKYHDFQLCNRCISPKLPISDCQAIIELCQNLLREHIDYNKGVRLLGVSLSKLSAELPPQPRAHPELPFFTHIQRKAI